MPVIFNTGYHEYKQDIAAWSSEDYIVKSVDFDELKAAVRQQLSQ